MRGKRESMPHEDGTSKVTSHQLLGATGKAFLCEALAPLVGTYGALVGDETVPVGHLDLRQRFRIKLCVNRDDFRLRQHEDGERTRHRTKMSACDIKYVVIRCNVKRDYDLPLKAAPLAVEGTRIWSTTTAGTKLISISMSMRC